jgi:hypothetical protein
MLAKVFDRDFAETIMSELRKFKQQVGKYKAQVDEFGQMDVN